MTPRDRAQLRLQQLALRLEPALRAAFLRVAQQLSGFQLGEMVRLLEAGDLDGAVSYVLRQPGLTAAVTELRAAYAAGVIRLVRDTARDRSIELRVRVAAPVASPDLIAAVRRWEDGAFARVLADVRAGLRETIATELTRGISPRQVAVALKQGIGSVGLTAYDAKIIGSFRAALEEGRFADALGRELRDKRFDRSLVGKRLSPAQIDKMVEAYRRKLVAFRAETFARTAGIQAANEAATISWQAAIDQGAIPKAEVKRYWVVAQDERLCKICEPIPGLNPRGVAIDQPFITPVERLFSPTAHPNCRCTVWIRRERAGVRRAPQPGTTRLILPRIA